MLKNLFSTLSVPSWLKTESVNRLALLCNHVIQQEPAAQQRLTRHSASRIHFKCLDVELGIHITPAGLIEAHPIDTNDLGGSVSSTPPDLFIAVKESSFPALLRTAAQGKKPDIHISGDVQLAAEINWLSQNLKWDVEEDLSRILGDALAHQVYAVLKNLASGLRSFLAQTATTHTESEFAKVVSTGGG